MHLLATIDQILGSNLSAAGDDAAVSTRPGLPPQEASGPPCSQLLRVAGLVIGASG